MIIGHFKFRRSWLSNFYNCHVEYVTASGKRYVYKSVEHGYQAQKATNRIDHDWVAAADGAAEARRRGRLLDKVRPGFDTFKERLMLKLLWSKFYHNSRLRQKLLSTQHHELVHGNEHGDEFWGVNRRTGHGRNRLGVLLMLLRQKIREGTDSTIPEMGMKKLQRHAAYRQRVRERVEDANLPVVVKRLPKLTHEEALGYYPSGRKRAAKRKGDKVAAMWSSTVTNVKEFNEKHQRKLREQDYGKVERLDPNRPGANKWSPIGRR